MKHHDVLLSWIGSGSGLGLIVTSDLIIMDYWMGIALKFLGIVSLALTIRYTLKKSKK